MIPYFTIPAIPLGVVDLQPFGLLTAAGLLLGGHVAGRQAARRALDPSVLSRFLLWGLVGGVVGAHLFHVGLYHPEELAADPWKLVRVWDGLSSFGGLFGGLIAAALFFRREKLSFGAYGDAIALGTAPGWAVARLGCFAVHDHPGVRTNFFLAVAFPGGARHDLGFYDALVLGLLTALLFLLSWRRLLEGRLLAVLALGYGTSRFFLDFLRASDLPFVDARYGGLTPAQYGSILLVAWGLLTVLRRQRRGRSDVAGSGTHGAWPAAGAR